DHKINIPLANGAGVTAGLISKADYDAFTAKVNRAGDTMSGDLDMSATKKVKNMADPSGLQDAATKNYVDTTIATAGGSYVLKAGDTMTGDLNLGGHLVTSIAGPSAGTDAANKTYVDSK